MGFHDGGPCSRVPTSACIEVTHQQQRVSEDLVELLLILLWVGHRWDVCADEDEVGAAPQWDAHGHQPVVDPFRKGFELGDENCGDGEAITGLPGFIGCLATQKKV